MVMMYSVDIGASLPVPVVNRATSADEPGGTSYEKGALEHAAWVLGYSDIRGYDNRVTHDSALTFSAVWGCIRYISQTVASMSWHQFERQTDVRVRIDIEDDISWILNLQASPEMTAFDWRQVMLKDALSWGNGYSEIERDGFGRVRWLFRIAPDRVSVNRRDNGQLYYEVDNGRGTEPTVLMPEQVFHLKGLGPDGIVGYSVIELARKSIELGMNQESFGHNYFAKGPMPGGILNIPGNASKTVKDEARDSFQRAYGGARNAGRVVAISGGMTFEAMGIPNADAQFLESRKFSVEELCRWYGVPPHKVASLERSTYSNIEQQAIEAVQDCILPWARRLESEADVKLFGRTNRGKRFTRINLATLLRGDSATQAATIVQKVNNGIMTINEGREYLELNPIEEGDTSLVQGAMIPLKTALEAEPNRGQAPARKGDSDQSQEPQQPEKPPEIEPPENVAAVFTELLADAYSRLLRVEADKAKRAANKGSLKDFVANFYGQDTRDHVANTLTHSLAGFMLAINRGAVGAVPLAADAAERHTAESVRILTERGGVPDNWQDRAAATAKREIQLAWEATR